MEPEQVARSMYARDASAEAFGIELVAAGLEEATVRMTVRPDMCNGFRIMHGGMTFVLADSAMAFASNAGDVRSLATSAEIDWLEAVRPGDVLTATARRRSNGTSRSQLWDVEVTNDRGSTVALFRGRTRQIGGAVTADPDAPGEPDDSDQANSEPR